jgi:predicted RNA-binding protein with PUA-like domain
MSYWLIKSEPDAFSYDDLERLGKSMWDGVRNYAARNNLRAMQEGDPVLFYHSQQGLEVVAICRVIHEHYPDPTATEGDWSVVEVAPLKRLKRSVTLKEIKSVPELQQIGLIRQSRLSVMPVTEAEFEKILELGEMTWE